MRHRSTPLILPLLGLALLGACDESTGPESDALTPEEARAVALAVDDGSTEAVDAESQPSFAIAPSGGASMDRVTISNSFNVSAPCPLGGNAAVDGEGTLTIDDVLGEILFDLTASKAHEGCAFRTQQGLEVTLDGTVSLSADRELRQGFAGGSQTHSGSLDFATSDGRRGTCVIDLTASFSLAEGEASRLVSGTVCGHSVDAETVWSYTQS